MVSFRFAGRIQGLFGLIGMGVCLIGCTSDIDGAETIGKTQSTLESTAAVTQCDNPSTGAVFGGWTGIPWGYDSQERLDRTLFLPNQINAHVDVISRRLPSDTDADAIFAFIDGTDRFGRGLVSTLRLWTKGPENDVTASLAASLAACELNPQNAVGFPKLWKKTDARFGLDHAAVCRPLVGIRLSPESIVVSGTGSQHVSFDVNAMAHGWGNNPIQTLEELQFVLVDEKLLVGDLPDNIAGGVFSGIQTTDCNGFQNRNTLCPAAFSVDVPPGRYRLVAMHAWFGTRADYPVNDGNHGANTQGVGVAQGHWSHCPTTLPPPAPVCESKTSIKAGPENSLTRSVVLDAGLIVTSHKKKVYDCSDSIACYDQFLRVEIHGPAGENTYEIFSPDVTDRYALFGEAIGLSQGVLAVWNEPSGKPYFEIIFYTLGLASAQLTQRLQVPSSLAPAYLSAGRRIAMSRHTLVLAQQIPQSEASGEAAVAQVFRRGSESDQWVFSGSLNLTDIPHLDSAFSSHVAVSPDGYRIAVSTNFMSTDYEKQLNRVDVFFRDESQDEWTRELRYDNPVLAPNDGDIAVYGLVGLDDGRLAIVTYKLNAFDLLVDGTITVMFRDNHTWGAPKLLSSLPTMHHFHHLMSEPYLYKGFLAMTMIDRNRSSNIELFDVRTENFKHVRTLFGSANSVDLNAWYRFGAMVAFTNNQLITVDHSGPSPLNHPEPFNYLYDLCLDNL